MKKGLIKASVLMVSVTVLCLTGCGPVDANAQNDLLNKDEGMEAQADNNMAPAGDDAAAPQADEAKDAAKPANEGCPAGGCPTGGCATGNCDIAPEVDSAKNIQMPDQYVTEPTKVTPTEEQRSNTDLVDIRTTKHVMQPHETHHTVKQHRNTHTRNWLKVVYHPSTRRINSIVKTFSATSETMPTEEVTEPVVDYGCAQPAPAVEQPVVIRPVLVRPVLVRPYLGLGLRRFY